MNRLRQILAGSCVVYLLFFLPPKGFGQGDPATGAKAKADFMKGQLLKVENVTDVQKNGQKAAYLLTIQGGAQQYFAYYEMTYFIHDRSSELEVGKDVEFRIDGKHLIVKTFKGQQVKMRLCQQAGYWIKCGGSAFSHGAGAPGS